MNNHLYIINTIKEKEDQSEIYCIVIKYIVDRKNDYNSGFYKQVNYV